MAGSISVTDKEGQKRQFAHTPDASACVVRCRRCLHGPRHRPSGTWLSSGIMPAPPAAAPSTRAPDHLHPLLVRCRLRRANTCARVFSCTGHCHDESDSLPHTGTCAVCGKLSDLSCLSPVQENTPQKCTTLLTGAEDGGAAVGLHDGRGRGLGARGAGLDEHDGLARLSAAEGRGGPREGPQCTGACVFSYPVPS